MCSIGEEDFGDEGGLHAMKKEELCKNNLNEEERTKICKKCNIAKVAVKLNFREAECENCFLHYARHKFRAALGSSKILPKNAQVLIVFDGTAESMVLLEMMHYAQTQNNFKRLHCEAKILYIEESVLNSSHDNDQSFLNRIKTYLQNFRFQSYITVLGNNPIEINELNSNCLKLKLIDEHFESNIMKIKSLSSKQDYIYQIRLNLIRSAAKKLNCHYIFLPDISTNLAATFLTNMSLGRGGSTALDISLLDDRIPNFKIIRPIKDLNDLEIKSYMKVSKLIALKNDFFGEDHGPNASIKNLTKRFVNDLQNEYSATVSTIFRTGDKMKPNYNQNITDQLNNFHLKSKLCRFCHSNLDLAESKTLLAIEFSSFVSENTGITNIEKLIGNQPQNLNTINCDDQIIELCHACRNLYKSCLDINLFS